MDEFITFKLPDAVEESVSAHVINEVKNQLPTLVLDVVVDFIRPRIHSIALHFLHTEHISLTTTPRLSTTNITIPEPKEQLLDMMSHNPNSIKGTINTDIYNALCHSRTSVVDSFNEMLDASKDPEDGEIEQDDSTVAFVNRLKRCLNVNKLTKEDLQQRRKEIVL
ncbi:hypothetical protein Tco_0520185 [Tanacetum coccineum]